MISVMKYNTAFYLLGGIFLSKQIKHLLVSLQENMELLSSS